MVDVFSSHGRGFNVEADGFVLFPHVCFLFTVF